MTLEQISACLRYIEKRMPIEGWKIVENDGRVALWHPSEDAALIRFRRDAEPRETLHLSISLADASKEAIVDLWLMAERDLKRRSAQWNDEEFRRRTLAEYEAAGEQAWQQAMEDRSLLESQGFEVGE